MKIYTKRGDKGQTDLLNKRVSKADLHIIVLENQMNDNSDLFYYTEKLIKDIIFESELVKSSR